MNVHRNGELAKSGSCNHRLSIAKLADVDEIPVLVRVRHADWQAVRDELRRADSPDLADLVPDRWDGTGERRAERERSR